MQKNHLFLSLTLLVALLMAAGCASTGDSGEAFDIPAQALANEGESAYMEGRYHDAADMFQQLKDRYPYSQFALLADLRVADAYFKSNRYDEAALAYDDFVRMHPRNEAVPYALYQMGMVYHSQILTPDRDSSWARRAVESFQRLIRNYPQDEYAHKAMPRFQEALIGLVHHEMSVGDFYFKSERYEAAAGRYRAVLTKYPDVGYYGQALEKIQICQNILAEMTPEEREQRAASRREPNNLPDTERYTSEFGMGLPF